MLSKRQRLTRQEFTDHFKTGRRVHTPHLTLVHSPYPTFHGSVVVGKKVAKRAVARNQLRRRIYGALYRLYREQGLTGVYIIIGKPSLNTLPRKALAAEVVALVGRSGK